MSTTDSGLESVINLSGAIAEYGIMIVICALMIVMFMAIMMVFIKNSTNATKAAVEQNNRFTQELINQNNQLTDKIIEQQEMIQNMIANSTEPYDKKNIVDIFLELNNVLKGTCKNTQETLKAGRVAVYVFHNGAVSSHGLPFFKMSCVSEWINRGSGFSTKVHEHTNLPLTMFASIVEQVKMTNTAHIYIQEEIKAEEPVFYSWMLKNNIHYCFIQGIYSSVDNTPMGYVTVEYADDSIDIEAISESVQRELKQACVKCAPVLEFSNFQQYKYGE